MTFLTLDPPGGGRARGTGGPAGRILPSGGGAAAVEQPGQTGAMLGERAYLEGGSRTSALEAVTACRVAAIDASQLDRSAPEELSGGHRREDADLGLG
ncbi:MAG: cyclic nucleotide-binding domain-containing protein [Actinomycetota bacterium]|nr:cyclic nucleotide-binding domain-containing protein [Actinomycetota bacterium]